MSIAPEMEVRVARRGVLGWPDEAPFDRILVSAMGRALPQELVDQLDDDGVMVAPWRDVMHRVRRTGGKVEVTDHGGYRFVPLLDTRF